MKKNIPNFVNLLSVAFHNKIIISYSMQSYDAFYDVFENSGGALQIKLLFITEIYICNLYCDYVTRSGTKDTD